MGISLDEPLHQVQVNLRKWRQESVSMLLAHKTLAQSAWGSLCNIGLKAEDRIKSTSKRPLYMGTIVNLALERSI